MVVTVSRVAVCTVVHLKSMVSDKHHLIYKTDTIHHHDSYSFLCRFEDQEMQMSSHAYFFRF